MVRLKFAHVLAGFWSLVGLVGSAIGATYYVSADGDDVNGGTFDEPWRTIGRAGTALQPGETVIVQGGTYDERIATIRGGTAEDARITFRAVGRVIMRGFVVNHPYVAIDGFEVTGHSGSNPRRGYIEVTDAGHHFAIVNNTLRDGIDIILPDLVFTDNGPSSDAISSTTGGFLAAGFKPGMTLRILRAAPGTGLANGGSHVIQAMTDHVLTLTESSVLVNEGPVTAYLTASYSYGLLVGEEASNGVARGNVFSNLSYDGAYLSGRTNLYEANWFERINGWDALHYSGEDNVYRRNVILNSPWRVFQTSPGALENTSTVPSRRLLLEENFVIGFDGSIGVHLINPITYGANGGLTFRRNVFVGGGRFNVRMPDVVFEHNTFLEVAANPSEVHSSQRHALSFDSLAGEYTTDGAVLRNNLFAGCGRGNNPGQQGWYEFTGDPATATAEANFVTGPAPVFSAKTGWPESDPALNGGDPGFVNIDDPLGPDGLPFTADDGLRLRPGSKLVGAGVGGLAIGAYEPVSVPDPGLTISLSADNQLRLSWPDTAAGWLLQGAPSVPGVWTNVNLTPVVGNGEYVVTFEAFGDRAFYRLAK